MAGKIILVDTSILINFYRRTDKNNSLWIALIKEGYEFAVSSVTKYEIYSGATDSQVQFWDSVFHELTIIPLDVPSVDVAVQINATLKRKRKQIDIADLFIAATAIAYDLPFATLNRKHFERIDDLNVI